VQNPRRGGLFAFRGLPRKPDWPGQELIDTPRCGGRKAPSAWEEVGRNPAKALVGDPRRVKPKGAPSGSRAKHTRAARNFRKGQNPGTVVCRAGLMLRIGYTAGRNGRWVLPGGNAPDTFREEKAPKGESHERRRCETKPARDRGE